MDAIFDCYGRPASKTGERPMKGKHGCYVMIFVRYLDGRQPTTAKMTRGIFDKLKPIRGNQATVWRRVDQLTTEDRMDPKRALAQATAEMAKGILAV